MNRKAVLCLLIILSLTLFSSVFSRAASGPNFLPVKSLPVGQNPLTSAESAIRVAKQHIGLDSILRPCPDCKYSAQDSLITNDSTPIFRNQINGRETWIVDITDFPISFLDRSDSLTGIITIRAILGQNSGHLLKISITFRDSAFHRTPDQLEKIETALNKNRVKYTLPDTAFTTFIDIVRAADIVSMDPFELDACYLIKSSKKWKSPKVIWKFSLKDAEYTSRHSGKKYRGHQSIELNGKTGATLSTMNGRPF